MHFAGLAITGSIQVIHGFTDVLTNERRHNPKESFSKRATKRAGNAWTLPSPRCEFTRDTRDICQALDFVIPEEEPDVSQGVSWSS